MRKRGQLFFGELGVLTGVERDGGDGGRNGAFDFGEEGRLLVDAFGLFRLDGRFDFGLDLFALGAFGTLLFDGGLVRLGSVVLFRRVERLRRVDLLWSLLRRLAFLRVAFRRLALFRVALDLFLGGALGRFGGVVFGDEAFDVLFVVVGQRGLALAWDGEGIDLAFVDFGDEARVILRFRGGLDATFLDGVDRFFV